MINTNLKDRTSHAKMNDSAQFPQLVDTHCHINSMIKESFDIPLTQDSLPAAAEIIKQAAAHGVMRIINVGTSLIESHNCLVLAKTFEHVWASVGIHPNDATENWLADFKEIAALTKKHRENKIVAIGECGLDRHYPDYNIARQIDAFKAQIELALEYDLAIIVHTRDAYDETLKVLEEYRNQVSRGIIHCFSEDLAFAQIALSLGFSIGLGGTITYPKNNILRSVATTIPLESIVLETDAPFLPIQSMRGKKNHPQYIYDIAYFLSGLRNLTLEDVARVTTLNACRIFNLD